MLQQQINNGLIFSRHNTDDGANTLEIACDLYTEGLLGARQFSFAEAMTLYQTLDTIVFSEETARMQLSGLSLEFRYEQLLAWQEQLRQLIFSVAYRGFVDARRDTRKLKLPDITTQDWLRWYDAHRKDDDVKAWAMRIARDEFNMQMDAAMEMQIRQAREASQHDPVDLAAITATGDPRGDIFKPLIDPDEAAELQRRANAVNASDYDWAAELDHYTEHFGAIAVNRKTTLWQLFEGDQYQRRLIGEALKQNRLLFV